MRTLPKLLLVAALSVSVTLIGCKRAQQIAHHAASSGPDYTTQLQSDITPGHMDALKFPDFRVLQPQIAALYDQHDFDLLWIKNGKPTAQARAMMEAFVNADDRGLLPEDYDASRWQQLATGLKDPDHAAAFDVAMTVDTMRFLGDLHQGRTIPNAFAFGVKGADTKRLDTITVINQQILNDVDIPQLLDSIEPQAAQFKALKTALAHYMELAAQDHFEQLPGMDTKAPGKALTAGYAYLQPLAQRLAMWGDLDNNATTDIATLTEALKHFQARHGILQSGQLTHDTIEALNTPVTARVTQIMDTMERWRWLDDSYQNAAILVNLPEFRLRAFEGNGQGYHEVFRMNVVDGKSDDPTHHTPVIADQMKYLVFRPFWNVPPSIAKKEIIPHIQANAGYLGAKNYETVDLHGNPAGADINRIAQGTVMVRQKSGTSNSLGLVKFMFPNPFNVYLHDTNEKALFSRNRRDYSHGCVRVQDPPKLANWVLRDNPKWDEQAIADAMNTGTDNKSVSLPHPIPVVIFYGTAWVDDGEVHFFQDMYGYDQDLEKVLQKGRPYPTKQIKQAVQADA